MKLSLFPSHYKGEETRQKIIKLLSHRNGLSTQEIAQTINRSVVQTKRQLQKIQVQKGVFFRNEQWFVTPKAYQLNITSYWD